MAAGGSFLLEETKDIFTVESLTAEQRDLAVAAAAFVEREVRPHQEAVEGGDFDLTVRLLKAAGELGVLGAEVPAEYGGLAVDLVTGAALAEAVAPAGSFALAVGAHTGIGTLPIVFFGSDEQKRRWLPGLASGRYIGAYALTEPDSGSDALAARTTAVAAADGSWRLTGTKQFITNSGFADVFVVYAKIDGRDFSAFIVPRDQPGVSLGPEEHKMGLSGSSTRRLVLDAARGELLGQPGRGHVVAFNILDIGRFKLGAACLGTGKRALALATAYAAGRVQFGRPIADFPLIREKLAAMNARVFALESMVYRTGALMDRRLAAMDDPSDPAAKAAAISEYAIECSAVKVYGSETLDFVVDEAVQIHGGNGYIRGFEVERLYRDSRVNRIFEGTNEINRLLIADQLFRRARSGRLPLLEAAQAVQGEILTLVPPPDGGPDWLLQAAKKIFLAVVGSAAQRFGAGLAQEQELLRVAADAVIDIYAAESAWLRAARTGDRLQEAMTALLVEETLGRVEAGAREALAFINEGDARRTALAVLRKLARHEPPDVIGLRRQIAAQVVARGGYAAGGA